MKLKTCKQCGTMHYKSNKYKRMYKEVKKERDDFDSILKAGFGELRFANLQCESLYNALDEIVSMTNDPLAKRIAEMAKERHQLDKLIHTRIIFEK